MEPFSTPPRPPLSPTISVLLVYSQLGQGTIRFVGILLSWAMPAYLRNKSLYNGEVGVKFCRELWSSHEVLMTSTFL